MIKQTQVEIMFVIFLFGAAIGRGHVLQTSAG